MKYTITFELFDGIRLQNIYEKLVNSYKYIAVKEHEFEDQELYERKLSYLKNKGINMFDTEVRFTPLATITKKLLDGTAEDKVYAYKFLTECDVEKYYNEVDILINKDIPFDELRTIQEELINSTKATIKETSLTSKIKRLIKKSR